MKILSVISFLIYLGCSSSPNLNASEKSYSTDGYYETEEAIIESNSDIAETPAISEEIEQKIIKSAYLSFEAQDIEATHKRILALVKSHKGIVQQDNANKGYNRLSQTLLVRVPAGDFQDFVNGVSKGVSFFDRRDISRQDVTEEFVDLQARLKAKRELEKRYLQLLSQAKNVKEMLEIERELSNIREEIEAKQGRLEYLKNKVSMSTVSIEFYKTTSQTGVTQSYGQKMKTRYKEGGTEFLSSLLGSYTFGRYFYLDFYYFS